MKMTVVLSRTDFYAKELDLPDDLAQRLEDCGETLQDLHWLKAAIIHPDNWYAAGQTEVEDAFPADPLEKV